MPRKLMLFRRDFGGFAGGHLKVWHYFTHAAASSSYSPRVYFTPNSVWNPSNPWWPGRGPEIAETWAPEQADAIFLGALDWQALPSSFRRASPVPIVNIVQGLSHTDPRNPKYAFLGHRAVRICINPILERAVRQVPHLNGPLVYIPMGLDFDSLPQTDAERFDVVVAALKAPRLGAEIAARLAASSRRIAVLDRPLPRAEYLRAVAEARVAVLLPMPQEGFYLPMLEAMAMRRIAVCPDCGGNRAYAVSGRNGFMPEYSVPAIAEAAEAALALAPGARAAMQDRGAETASAYTLERERAAFFDVLAGLDTIWRGLR